MEATRRDMVLAKSVLQELRKCGVTHVIGVPDNTSAALFHLLGTAPEIKLLPVTREGEAFAIASGLWIGGKNPVVLIQNTGFFESGDGYRGTALRMRIPLACLITYRGYRKLKRYPLDCSADLDAETYSRPELDSAAIFTEPTLKAWGLPFDFLHHEEDVPKISWALSEARAQSRPVALLVTVDMT
jgi:sulfopyruvate decarboxylase TPP-binding subunit